MSLKLEFLQLSDVAKIREWYLHPFYYAEYFRRMPPLESLSDEQVFALFEVAWAVKVDHEVVGLISLNNFDYESKQCEYGLLVEPGVGSKAKMIFDTGRDVTSFVFHHCKLNKIYTRVVSGRRNIQIISKAFGFRLEGTLRDNLLWNGMFVDEDIYGLRAEDYYEGIRLTKEHRDRQVQENLARCIEIVTLGLPLPANYTMRYTL